jgi:hypothetical protein
MKHTKILLPLKKENCISKYHDCNIKIYKKLIDMGLGEYIPFEHFLLNLQIEEETYILGLKYAIKKPTSFLKCKPNDICTNVFGIYVGPLWEANIDTQYILDPYATTSYFTSYLTKIDEFVTQEMKIILEKM